MTTRVDAHALVSAARDLIRDDDAATAGLWPRLPRCLPGRGWSSRWSGSGR